MQSPVESVCIQVITATTESRRELRAGLRRGDLSVEIAVVDVRDGGNATKCATLISAKYRNG